MKLLLLFFTAVSAISQKELYEDSSSSEDDTSSYDSSIVDTKASKNRETGVYPLGSKSIGQIKEKKNENSIVRSKYWRPIKESGSDENKLTFESRKNYKDMNLLWDSQLEEIDLGNEFLNYFEDELKDLKKQKLPKKKNAEVDYYDEYLPENKMTYKVMYPQQKYEENLPLLTRTNDFPGIRSKVHLAVDPPKISPSTPLLESSNNEEIIGKSEKDEDVALQQPNFSVEYPLSSIEISQMSYPVLPAVVALSIDITDCVILLLLAIVLIWILKIAYMRYISVRPVLSTNDVEKGDIKKNGPM